MQVLGHCQRKAEHYDTLLCELEVPGTLEVLGILEVLGTGQEYDSSFA